MLGQTFRWAAPLLVLGMIGTILPAQDKKPDDKKPDSKAEKVEKDKKVDKLVRAGELAGKVIAWDNQDYLLTISVPVVVSDGIDEGAVKAIQQAQIDLVNASKDRSANGVRNALDAQKRLIENQLKVYKYKTIQQEFEVHVADNAKVRLLNLPIQFDEKGFPVTRSKDEIKQLKGSDHKLPGFEGSMEDVKNEATVIVVLTKKKKETDAKEKTTKEPPKEKAPTVKTAPPSPDEPIKLGRTIEATMILVGAVPDSKDKDK